jgi:hypothetical protein
MVQKKSQNKVSVLIFIEKSHSFYYLNQSQARHGTGIRFIKQQSRVVREGEFNQDHLGEK